MKGGRKMLRWKFDVYRALIAKGYTTYKIREQNLLAQGTMTKLKNGQGVGWENIDTLCRLLECQPSDLIEHVDIDRN